jgi:hypothetical protein
VSLSPSSTMVACTLSRVRARHAGGGCERILRLDAPASHARRGCAASGPACVSRP